MSVTLSILVALLMLGFLFLGALGYSHIWRLPGTGVVNGIIMFLVGVVAPLISALMVGALGVILTGMDPQNPWSILMFIGAVLVIQTASHWLRPKEPSPPGPVSS